jgi:hypothetical protein
MIGALDFERAQAVGCCIAKRMPQPGKGLRHPLLMGNGDRIHDPRHTRNLESDRLGRAALDACTHQSI